MVGYWDKKPVVTTSSKDVLATAYIKDKKMLICIASWEPTAATVTFTIDVKSAGLDPNRARVKAPAIIGLQAETPLTFNTPITVNFQKGCVLLVDEDPLADIEEYSKVSPLFTVYPSIVSDGFTVEANYTAMVSIKNIFGSVVYKSVMHEKLEIDASSWPTGIYLVEIERNGESEVVKVVKI
jgi:hypothetical protein